MVDQSDSSDLSEDKQALCKNNSLLGSISLDKEIMEMEIPALNKDKSEKLKV